MATGDYIAFIDADDLVSDKYIETILNKAKTEKFDYCYMSWKAFGGWDMDVKLNSVEDQFPPFNLCVWNRVYKRSMIGSVRFNTNKAVAEDAQFIREVKEQGKKKAFISDYMYFYRSNTENSLTKRAGEGKLDVKRIVYYYSHVTPEMTFLLDEFKQEDQDAEIILMTYQNDIPELKDYAMVIPPGYIRGTELRGQRTPYFQKLETPIKTQVLIFVDTLFKIGGIETWTYNFCKAMHKYYDIAVMGRNIDETQRNRLLPYAQIIIDFRRPILCDTAINCRYVLELPANVEYKKYFQVVHTCKMKDYWTIKDQADKVIYVSRVAADSFGDDQGKVIHNLTDPQDVKKLLILVSASRLSYEKGGGRMIQFGWMLKKLKIPYVWYCFTDDVLQGAPPEMVFKKPTLDIRPYIKAADFLVQLSDQESFCYSIVEALELGTKIISTPLPVLSEIGFRDGVHGFTVPFDVEKVENLEYKLYKHYDPVMYRRDNAKIVKQWRAILGNTKPTKKKAPKKGYKWVMALLDFRDVQQQRDIKAGEVYQTPAKRAEEGQKQGFWTILN
jgi:glycosyltransferase involved in cell wall biosynthesis